MAITLDTATPQRSSFHNTEIVTTFSSRYVALNNVCHPSNNINSHGKVVFAKELKKQSLKANIANKYQLQLDKYSKYLECDISVLDNLYNNALESVLSLGFPNVNISITSNPSISFKLEGIDDFVLYYEVFQTELNQHKVVFSLYNKKELIEMNSGTMIESTKLILETLRSSLSRPTKDFVDISIDTRAFEFA